VTPGVTYFFQPVAHTTEWVELIGASDGGYTGGTGFTFGVGGGADFWFREGIIVPEPSAALLLLVGGALFTWLRRRKESG
jgi:hypothetical protein